MLIPEGNSGTFTIERSAGSSGECTVYWSLSDDGTDDMNQTNGTVVFANVSIVLQYMCRLYRFTDECTCSYITKLHYNHYM